MSVHEASDGGSRDQRAIFTDEEKSLGEMLIYDAFRHQHFFIDSSRVELGEGLKRAEAFGCSLSLSSKLLTQVFLEIIKEAAVTRGSEGRQKPSISLLDAVEGGETLLSVLRIGEENSKVIEQTAGQTIDKLFDELKISTGRDASLSDKVNVFLLGTKNFPIIRKLFQDDPSGFSLVDEMTSQINKNDSALFLDVPYLPRFFFDKGLERTGTIYKHLYEVGFRAGIQAPKPKNRG